MKNIVNNSIIYLVNFLLIVFIFACNIKIIFMMFKKDPKTTIKKKYQPTEKAQGFLNKIIDHNQTIDNKSLANIKMPNRNGSDNHYKNHN